MDDEEEQKKVRERKAGESDAWSRAVLTPPAGPPTGGVRRSGRSERTKIDKGAEDAKRCHGLSNPSPCLRSPHPNLGTDTHPHTRSTETLQSQRQQGAEGPHPQRGPDGPPALPSVSRSDRRDGARAAPTENREPLRAKDSAHFPPSVDTLLPPDVEWFDYADGPPCRGDPRPAGRRVARTTSSPKRRSPRSLPMGCTGPDRRRTLDPEKLTHPAVAEGISASSGVPILEGWVVVAGPGRTSQRVTPSSGGGGEGADGGCHGTPGPVSLPREDAGARSVLRASADSCAEGGRCTAVAVGFEPADRRAPMTPASCRDIVGEYKRMRAEGKYAHVVQDADGGYRVVVPHRSRDTACMDAAEMDPTGWQEADSCADCGRQFGWTLFRHHCRRCGKSLCWRHSSWTAYSINGGADVRVCARCHRELEDREASCLAFLMVQCEQN